MADFTVNIDAELTPQYTVTANKLYSETDCIQLDEELPIGLIKTTNSFNIYYLLTDYIDASSWKTLKIKNVVYSNPTGFYLSDTLVKIPEAGATVYDFDITGQAVDIAIADLTVTYDALNLVQNETITFDLAIENLVPTIGAYTSVTISIKHSTCPPVGPINELTIVSIVDDNCTLQDNVTVHVPPEGSRYVTVIPADGFGSPTVSGETITEDKTYNLIIAADIVGTLGDYSAVILRVFESISSTTSLDSHSITRKHIGTIC